MRRWRTHAKSPAMSWISLSVSVIPHDSIAVRTCSRVCLFARARAWFQTDTRTGAILDRQGGRREGAGRERDFGVIESAAFVGVKEVKGSAQQHRFLVRDRH